MTCHVTILSVGSDDWAEVWVDGKLRFRGHESDIEPEALLDWAGVPCYVQHNCEVEADGRTIKQPEHVSRFVSEPGDLVLVKPAEVDRDGA